MKTIEQVREEYSKLAQQARKDKILLNLNSLSDEDKKAISLLAQLADMVGGKEKLAQLFQVLTTVT